MSEQGIQGGMGKHEQGKKQRGEGRLGVLLYNVRRALSFWEVGPVEKKLVQKFYSSSLSSPPSIAFR